MSTIFRETEPNLPHERWHPPVLDRTDTALVVGVLLIAFAVAWLFHPAWAVLAVGVAFIAYALRAG